MTAACLLPSHCPSQERGSWVAVGTASAWGMGHLPGDRDGLRLDQDVHPQVGVRISRVCGLAGLPGLFQALSNGLKNKTCFPLASFLAAFPPQRRSGCLCRVGSEQVTALEERRDRPRSLQNTGYRGGVSHSGNKTERWFQNYRWKEKASCKPPNLSALWWTPPLKTLLTPPSPFPQQNHDAKFCSPSMNSATKTLITVPNPPSLPHCPLPAPEFLTHHCKTESLCCWETLSQLWDQVQQQCSCSHTMLNLNH